MLQVGTLHDISFKKDKNNSLRKVRSSFLLRCMFAFNLLYFKVVLHILWFQ